MTTQTFQTRLAALVLAGFTVTGCTASNPTTPASTSSEPSAESTPGSPVVTNDDLSGETWLPLRKYVPRAWRPESPPDTGSVTFKPDGTWTGFDGCNGLSGTYRLRESRLTFLSWGGTDIGCANMYPSDALAEAFITLNASATRLTAKDSDGHVLIEYRR